MPAGLNDLWQRQRVDELRERPGIKLGALPGFLSGRGFMYGGRGLGCSPPHGERHGGHSALRQKCPPSNPQCRDLLTSFSV